MSNGIYDILGKLASLTPKEEAAKTEPQKIYESVEAKGSILEGVSAIEAKLQQQFNESAAPGQEDWIKSNKARFIKQYGKKKGLEVLYATAWKRSKADESAELCAECGLAEAECTCVHEGETTKTATGIRHKGTYGTEYQGDPDEEEEEQRKIDTGTRTRGRPRKHAKVEKVPGRGRGRPKAEKPPFSGKNAAGALTNMLFGKAPKLSGKGRVHRMDEGRMLDETGNTLDHILTRYASEVKQFENNPNSDLDRDLYDALYDYYAAVGEMPYGVQKARTGDPYEWVCQQLEKELGMYEAIGTEGVEECGMGAGSVGAGPVPTLEEEMAELVELAKLAGIETEGNAFGAAVAKAKADGIQPGEKVEVGGEEYPVKEDEVEVNTPAEEPANSPDEEYISMRASTLNPGEGDNGEKQMNPDRPTFKNGDNALSKPPVREKAPTLEARLAAEYESIKKISK